MIFTMASVADATGPAAPAAAPTIFAPDVIAGNANGGTAARWNNGDAAHWNNGDDHIWQLSLVPWLDSSTGCGH